MPTTRFNHMELTFARGTLTPEFRGEVADFYGGVFGWNASDVQVVGQDCLYLHVDEGQFILCAEVDNPMQSPSYDHLGLLMDTRTEVDTALAAIKARAATDERIRLKEYEDLVMERVTVHAFYVKYLLPIYFDVQCLEYASGATPANRWVFQRSD
jgi:predicted enzyme related to lactoylglutathione lyase